MPASTLLSSGVTALLMLAEPAQPMPVPAPEPAGEAAAEVAEPVSDAPLAPPEVPPSAPVLAPAAPPAVAETVIISTDSKAPQQDRHATQNVLVVDEFELNRSEAAKGNIADLLALQPGFFVSTLSRNDANWGSYGGLGPKYNAYLLDGLPVDPFVDTMALDPWLIERVESVQGPAAVPYGNYLNMDFTGNESPLAGITQLVARERIETPETRVAVGGGSWSTLLGRALRTGKADNLHYVVGGSYEQSDYTNYGSPGSWLGMIQSPSYEKAKVYGKATWFGGEHLKLSTLVSHASHTGLAGRPNRDYDHGYDLVNLTAAWKATQSTHLTLRAGYRGYDRRWAEDNYAGSGELSLRQHDGVRQKILPADLTLTWQHLGESMLTAGLDAQSVTYSSYSETETARALGNDVTASQLGLFVQEKWVSGPWVVRGGLRLGWTDQRYRLLSGSTPGIPSKSWTKLLWSAGVRWNGPVSLFFNGGSSFLAPSAKAVGGTLTADSEGVVGRDGQLPNPDLRAESGLGLDAGAQWQLGRVKTVARGFLTLLDDAIVDNRVSSAPSQTRSVNAGKARSYGAELSLSGRVVSGVRWFANGSLVSSSIDNPLDADQDGAQIPFVPSWTANVGVSASLPWDLTLVPTLRMGGTYYDSTSLSGRTAYGKQVVPSLSVSKVLRGESYRVNLALDLNNLTDNRYLMPWGFRDPGFNALARAELRL